MTEQQEPTILEMDEQLDAKTGELIEANAKMTTICRKQAQDLLKIALAYEGLAEMARACADMNAEMAKRAAEITGDIIKQEWGLLDDDEYEFEDDEEEDEEDEEDEDE